jgi:NADPH-dependent 2,4-dienoyl-CoA reductase/sulfur reductase-like enzyme
MKPGVVDACIAFGIRVGRGTVMTEHAVVIAGGGPTGLMLAGELSLAGIDVGIGGWRMR